MCVCLWCIIPMPVVLAVLYFAVHRLEVALNLFYFSQGNFLSPGQLFFPCGVDVYLNKSIETILNYKLQHCYSEYIVHEPMRIQSNLVITKQDT